MRDYWCGQYRDVDPRAADGSLSDKLIGGAIAGVGVSLVASELAALDVTEAVPALAVALRSTLRISKEQAVRLAREIARLARQNARPIGEAVKRAANEATVRTGRTITRLGDAVHELQGCAIQIGAAVAERKPSDWLEAAQECLSVLKASLYRGKA